MRVACRASSGSRGLGDGGLPGSRLSVPLGTPYTQGLVGQSPLWPWTVPGPGPSQEHLCGFGKGLGSSEPFLTPTPVSRFSPLSSSRVGGDCGKRNEEPWEGAQGFAPLTASLRFLRLQCTGRDVRAQFTVKTNVFPGAHLEYVAGDPAKCTRQGAVGPPLPCPRFLILPEWDPGRSHMGTRTWVI